MYSETEETNDNHRERKQIRSSRKERNWFMVCSSFKQQEQKDQQLDRYRE